MSLRTLGFALSAVLLATASQPALAQQVIRSAPQAIPVVDTIPAARDVAYPGTMRLDIDATDIDRKLFRVTQTIPVPQGQRELILLLPEWLPGNHSPRGTINLLANIRFEANGRTVPWTRDPSDVFAFRVAVPAGAREVTATFVHTSPLQTSEGRITMTQEMLNLQWEKMSLYPAGYYVRQIKVTPTVTFPTGWKVFTALDGQRQTAGRGNRVTWDTIDYETLVDSPIFAGKYSREWDLGNDVAMQAIADKPELLEIAPEHARTYNKLVDESLATFGARHFDHYEFLLALTNRMGGIGLEHHRSSENQYEPKDWVDWEGMAFDRNVISHEFVHSWNGKYRRPARLWTPDYRQPMQDNLLWMYEGQTQFWGWILAARSGIQPKDIVLGALAHQAGAFSLLPGRAWRSVEDTTHDPIIDWRRPQPYGSISRNEDYYNEGMLVWLEADQIIRQGTNGARGLDDFARAFFGMNDGDWGQLTYEFADIVATLNGVYPYDWAQFLTTRLQTPGAAAPVAGIDQAGYRLIWREEPNPYTRGVATDGKYLHLLYSLGVNLDAEGKVTSSYWESPAFKAGLVTGTQVMAVNGQAYSEDAMRSAITAAKTSSEPIRLTVKRGEEYLTVPIDYHGGLKYPWIEPKAAGEQGLDRLLAPRTG